MPLGTPNSTLIHQGPGWLYLNVAAPAPSARHLIGADGTPVKPLRVNGATYTVGTMIVAGDGSMWECSTGGTTLDGLPGDIFALTFYVDALVGVTVADNTCTWTKVAEAPSYIFAGGLDGATEINLAPKVEAVSADQETLPVDVVMTGETESLAVTLKESDAAKLRLILPHTTFDSNTDTDLPAGAQTYEEISFGGLPSAGLPKFGVLFISKRKDHAHKFIVTQLYRAYQKDAVKLPVQRGKETTYKVEFDALADKLRPVGDRGGKIYRQT